LRTPHALPAGAEPPADADHHQLDVLVELCR
jgi:hypothetical protein